MGKRSEHEQSPPPSSQPRYLWVAVTPVHLINALQLFADEAKMWRRLAARAKGDDAIAPNQRAQTFVELVQLFQLARDRAPSQAELELPVPDDDPIAAVMAGLDAMKAGARAAGFKL